jgi:hypothetical protein
MDHGAHANDLIDSILDSAANALAPLHRFKVQRKRDMESMFTLHDALVALSNWNAVSAELQAEQA